MTKNSLPSDQPPLFEGTQVDFGEDLLSQTLTGSKDSNVQHRHSEIEDMLQTVGILKDEGLLDEAKKILRKILRIHPNQILAHQKLEEIQKIELHQILEVVPAPHSQSHEAAMGLIAADVHSETIMKNLDIDLRLGIFSDDGFFEERSAVSLFFSSQSAMEKFANKLDQDLAGVSFSDRMDIGIAFLEIGLFEVAARQFRVAAREPASLLAASSLLAYSLILAGHPFEAVLTLEPFFEDAELKPDEKIDLMYMMGRAYESLQKPQKASHWFKQVSAIKSSYRDVDHRLRFLSGY